MVRNELEADASRQKMALDQKENCHEKACDFLSDPPLRTDPDRLAVGSARAADNVAMDICTSCTKASFNVLGQIKVTIAQEQAADSFDVGVSQGLGSAGVSGGTGDLSGLPSLGCMKCQASAFGGFAPGEGPDASATGFSFAQAANLTYWDILPGKSQNRRRGGCRKVSDDRPRNC